MSQSIAVIISVFSLMVSLSGLYWNSFRVRHDLIGIVSSNGPPFSDRPRSITGTDTNYQITLINKGNQPEAILQLALYYEVMGEVRSPGPAPFVIDKGSISVDTLTLGIHSTVFNLLQSTKEWSDFGIYIEYLTADNLIQKRNVSLGKIKGVAEQDGASEQIVVLLDPKSSNIALIKQSRLSFL